MRFSDARSILSTLCLLLLPLTTASVLTISIPPTSQLPNPNTLPASTHATLTTLALPLTQSSNQEKQEISTILKAPISRSSTFTFRDLRPSTLAGAPQRVSYLLDIHSRDYVFAPYRVDIAVDGSVIGIWETYRGNPWENKGPEKENGSGSGNGEVVAVEAKILRKKEFYEERPKFSPLSLFKNPMILLAVFALAITVGMPYIMDNMDPEMREEFEKQRSSGIIPGGSKKGAGAANFDLAGWMAGTSPGPLDSAKAAAATGTDEGRQQPATRRR